MKKLKILLIAILSVCAIAAFALFAAACNKGDENVTPGGELEKPEGGGGESGGGGSTTPGGGESSHTHEYGELVKEVPATCTHEGMQAHYYCEGCQTYFTEQKTETTEQALKIGMIEHEYGTKIEEVPATCTKGGMHAYYQCSECHTYFTEDKIATTEQALKIGIDSTAHTYSTKVEKVPATCTQKGMQAYFQCTECEKFFDENKVEKTEQELVIEVDSTAHTYGELVKEVPATCTDKGMQAYCQCTECQNYFTEDHQPTTIEELEININPNGHKWSENNECEYCHKTKPAYTMSADGTKVYFGEYPQSEVTSQGLKVTLKMEAGIEDEATYYEWDEFEDFYETGYNYKDVVYQGTRYRGMYFYQYLKYFTWNKNYDGPDDTNSWQDNFGYSLNKLYWFKFEPIEWNILEQTDGTAVLMANIALDSYYFYPYGYGITDTSGDPRGDSWDISSLRKWLNGEFLNLAFDYESIQLIPTTHLVNYNTHGLEGGQITRYPDTDDKIYLLSNQDLTTYSLTADLLKRKATPYAKFKNVYMQKLSEPDGYCRWWLRSTGQVNGYTHVQSIEGDQGLYKTGNWYGWDVCNLLGVVPVLRLNLIDE